MDDIARDRETKLWGDNKEAAGMLHSKVQKKINTMDF